MTVLKKLTNLKINSFKKFPNANISIDLNIYKIIANQRILVLIEKVSEWVTSHDWIMV